MSNVMSYFLAATFVTSGLMAAHGQAKDKGNDEYNARMRAKFESAEIKAHAQSILEDSQRIARKIHKGRIPVETCEMFNSPETRNTASILTEAYETSVAREGERKEIADKRVADFGIIANGIQANIDFVNRLCRFQPGAPMIEM